MEGAVGDVAFDVQRGFFDAPFQLNLATATPGAQVRYTTDGSAPTATTGALFTGPVAISDTTVVRAAAFRDGFIPSRVATHTYLFLGSVINQPSNPAGFPGGFDYAMDPEITTKPAYAGEMRDAFRSIPTLSITAPRDDFFGSSRGIIANSRLRGEAWERACSVELILPDGSTGFAEDCGIRVHGNGSRSAPKNAFRIMFRGEYGRGKLEYPLFGPNRASHHDEVVLRAQASHSWHRGSGRAMYLRDTFARDTALP